MAHEGHWREKTVYGENKGPLALSKFLQSLTGVKKQNKTESKQVMTVSLHSHKPASSLAAM